MNVNNNGFTSIEQITGQYLKTSPERVKKQESQVSFQQALSDAARLKNAGVTFSKHAEARLQDRNIVMTDEQLERLNEGTRKASQKGIKESLVLLDNLAFIVNTKNNMVITAMSSDVTNENVYTNIDGAVVI